MQARACKMLRMHYKSSSNDNRVASLQPTYKLLRYLHNTTEITTYTIPVIIECMLGSLEVCRCKCFCMLSLAAY